MGIYPEPFLNVMHVSVENLIERYQGALAAAQGATSLAAR
jgi:NADH:ubiquinone oxidoreductase subunit 4 (subunit M)